jgi:signal transduction histidine kinase
VAHEVNNPNNSIMFNAPIILSAWQDATRILDRHHREPGGFQLAGLPYPDMREAISRMILGISDSSLRIKNIVAVLKGFARQEEDTPHSVIDVNEVVRSVVAILNHEIMKRTHRFRTTFGAEHPTVMGSAAQLEQVLMNLILNSIQSLPDTGRAVEVSTGIEFRAGTVEIRVRDEGTGIPPDVLGKITDPFFTTKHASGGLGLGLSISMAIVEKHGGEMNFRSVVGHGTEAVIALPLASREGKIPASA